MSPFVDIHPRFGADPEENLCHSTRTSLYPTSYLHKDEIIKIVNTQIHRQEIVTIQCR